MTTKFDLPTKENPEGFTIYNGFFSCTCTWDADNDCPAFYVWNNDDRDKKVVLKMTSVDHFLMFSNVVQSTREAIRREKLPPPPPGPLSIENIKLAKGGN